MKKAVMCFIGAMMVLSLAACTPTMEKHKVGEVQNSDMAVPKSTQGPGVVTEDTGSGRTGSGYYFDIYSQRGRFQAGRHHGRRRDTGCSGAGGSADSV